MASSKHPAFYRRHAAGSVQSLAGKRVVIVEDEVIVKMGIEQAVTDAGASMVKSVKQPCDVAVLDVRLDPGRTIRPIALDLARRGIPFLFYTGCSEQEIKALQRHLPESLVLRKPATPDQLLSAILAVLRG